MSLIIREINAADINGICEIYNDYVDMSTATFDESPVSAEIMSKKATDLLDANMPWLVAMRPAGEIVGYAYASRWRPRGAYRFSAESTVYVKHSCSGEGAGTRLYSALLDRLAEQNLHTVLGVVTLPNAASVALHEKFGFEKIAHLKEVGFKFGRWLDVGYWQKML